MGLKHRMTGFFGGGKNASEQKTSAAAPLLVQFGTGQPRFTPRRYDRLAEEGFRKNVIAYRCIRLIAQNAAAVPWSLYQGHQGNRVKLHDHPLLSLINRPNPMQGRGELMEALCGFFMIAGNAWLEAVGPSGETPHELWALRPDRMTIVPGRDGTPDAYRYSTGGQKIDFKVDRVTGRAAVLHLKNFHPLDDWYGMSPLEAAAFSIDQHNAAAKWNTALLQNCGRPGGALVYNPPHADGPDTLTAEQRQVLKDELERHYSGGDNAGRPLVLEGGLDWKEMSLSPKDMDWLAGKDMAAREIALAYNVPPQLVGVEGSLTYANFEQARLALYDDAVLPLLAHMRDELNNWLVPQFGADLKMDFDLDAVEALAPRREKIWSRLNNASFMTVNEKRAALGLSPLPDGDCLEMQSEPAS
jgi:HK97 family phage portal protein